MVRPDDDCARYGSDTFCLLLSGVEGVHEAEAIGARIQEALRSVAVREAPATPAMTQLDLAAVMEAKAASAGQTLNWRSSIVDLMKLLGLDSSLAARKELAGELGYTGDTSDSAAMNVWLHKQVMQKVAENGGQVPADLQT